MRAFERGLTRLVVAVVAGALAIAAGVFAHDATRPEQTRVIEPGWQTHIIEPSYAFDVTDPSQVAHHADNVFVGRMAAIDGVDQSNGAPRTIFKVDVEETIR